MWHTWLISKKDVKNHANKPKRIYIPHIKANSQSLIASSRGLNFEKLDLLSCNVVLKICEAQVYIVKQFENKLGLSWGPHLVASCQWFILSWLSLLEYIERLTQLGNVELIILCLLVELYAFYDLTTHLQVLRGWTDGWTDGWVGD